MPDTAQVQTAKWHWRLEPPHNFLLLPMFSCSVCRDKTSHPDQNYAPTLLPKIRSKIRSHVSCLPSSSFLAPNTPLRRTTSNRPEVLNRKRTRIPDDPPSPSPCKIPPQTPKYPLESADRNKRQPGRKKTWKCINSHQPMTTSWPYCARNLGWTGTMDTSSSWSSSAPPPEPETGTDD